MAAGSPGLRGGGRKSVFRGGHVSTGGAPQFGGTYHMRRLESKAVWLKIIAMPSPPGRVLAGLVTAAALGSTAVAGWPTVWHSCAAWAVELGRGDLTAAPSAVDYDLLASTSR